MNAYIYFNLHKKTFSVRYNGRVIYHADRLQVTSPTFKVSEAGRQRVLQEKRKNVHAYVIAPIANVRVVTDEEGNVDGWDAVTYNPYRDSAFVKRTPDREQVHSAYEAWLQVDDSKRPSIHISGNAKNL